MKGMIVHSVRGNKGVTLIELLISLAIFGMVLLPLAGLNLFGTRTFNEGEIEASAQFESRKYADLITSQARYAILLEILETVPFDVVSGSYIPVDGEGFLFLDDEGSISYYYKAPDSAPGFNSVRVSISKDYTLMIRKAPSNDDIIQFTVGKTSGNEFDITSEVAVLNLSSPLNDIEGLGIRFIKPVN